MVITEKCLAIFQRQAPKTTILFLENAIREINNQYGKGYAQEHPEQVVMFFGSSRFKGQKTGMSHA